MICLRVLHRTTFSLDLPVFTSDILHQDKKWLKIASIGCDIIHCPNSHIMTPKHYLLANELFRHERSCQLLTITNRLGYTCSNATMRRLQQEVAEATRSSCNSFSPIEKTSIRNHHHEFASKAAENFDLNKDTLHGENSIHILNQIIVTTSE